MVNGDEFQVKLLANLSNVALVNNIEFVALNAVFTQFRLDQRQGQLRPVDRDIGATFKQVRHRTNMILVTMSEHQSLHPGQLLLVEVVQPGKQ